MVSFKMKGRYHGNNGANNEWVRISADGQTLSTIYSNSTTSGSSLSAWQDVAFVVPNSYTGTGSVSMQIQVYGYHNEVHLDDLRIKSMAYGSLDSVLQPSRVQWGESGGVSQISLGTRHSCALMSSGSVNCWGYNGGSYANILGSPSYKGESTYDPKEVDLSGASSLAATNWTGSTVDGINAGDGVSCAIMRSTEALCWGSSTQGLGGWRHPPCCGETSRTTRAFRCLCRPGLPRRSPCWETIEMPCQTGLPLRTPSR